MATIAEIRQKYPQYQDMSDEQLARALHSKHYADIDFADFARRVELPYSGGPAQRYSAKNAPEPRTAVDEAKRQAGLTARIPVDTAAALPLAALEAGAAIGNKTAEVSPSGMMGRPGSLGLGGSGGVSFRQIYDDAMARIFPTPETTAEKVTNVGGQVVLGGRVPTGLPPSNVPANFIRMTPKQQVAEQAIREGYVVPPATLRPNAVTKTLEGVAGKLSTAQLASAKNTAVTNRLANRSLGLDDEAALSREALKAIRDEAGGAYEAVKASGTVTTDDAFTRGVQGAVGRYQGAAKDFKTLGRPDLQRVADDLSKAGADDLADPFAAPPKPLVERVQGDPELRSSFAQLRYELGWDSVGGRALGREHAGYPGQRNVEGSTQWIPRHPFFGLGNFPEYAPGQRLSEPEIKQVIDLVLAGKTKNLGDRQRQVADYLAEVAADRLGNRSLMSADELASLSDDLRAEFGAGRAAPPASAEQGGKQFDASSAVDAIRALREKADTAFRGGDSAAGKAYKTFAAELEKLLGRHLEGKGQNKALAEYLAARTKIAKTYTVEKALNQSTGNVSATKLARELEKGKPLSGDLKTAAQFGQAFPKAARDFNESLPGISPLDFYAAGGVTAMSQKPWYLLYPFLRQGVRNAMLSQTGQRLLLPKGGPVRPEYANALAYGAASVGQ